VPSQARKGMIRGLLKAIIVLWSRQLTRRRELSKWSQRLWRQGGFAGSL
jgi:hypothetical protein